MRDQAEPPQGRGSVFVNKPIRRVERDVRKEQRNRGIGGVELVL